jgi:hypothetical protein
MIRDAAIENKLIPVHLIDLGGHQAPLTSVTAVMTRSTSSSLNS